MTVDPNSESAPVVTIDQPRGPLSEPITGDLSPREHVMRALELPSPFPPPEALSPHLQRAVEELAKRGSGIETFWEAQLSDLRARVRARGRVDALEEVLREEGYDDPECAQLLRGSDLVGVLPGRPA